MKIKVNLVVDELNVRRAEVNSRSAAATVYNTGFST